MPGAGVDTTDQDAPSQCSASVCAFATPTAQMSFPLIAVIARKLPIAGPATGTVVHWPCGLCRPTKGPMGPALSHGPTAQTVNRPGTWVTSVS